MGAVGDRCNDYGGGNAGCCSGLCESSGNPARRVCLSNGAPTTPAPVAPPTPEATPAPVGSCGGNKSQCSDNFDCCSFNCKGGQCKGGR